jgi:hypothetical protein
MGSFRTLAERRGNDVRTITAADRPLAVRDPHTKRLTQIEVAPEDWLGEGESVTYWAILPHTSVSAIVAAGSSAVFDKRGKPVRLAYDAGAAIRARLVNGIIDWTMFDQAGQPVPWDMDKGADLLNGLPDGVYDYLQRNVGNQAPASLATVDPATANAEGDGPSVGETSAGS